MTSTPNHALQRTAAMTIYSQRRSSRNVESILVALFGAAFATLCTFLVFTSSIGFFGVLMAAFSMLGVCVSVYCWLFPFTATLDLIPEQLQWHSPAWPRQTRAIRLSDIAAARLWPQEGQVVELRLRSGEKVTVPEACTGYDGARLVGELSRLISTSVPPNDEVA